MDVLGELTSQAVGVVAGVLVVGAGVIAGLVMALIVQVRKNKGE